tara:strand:+ start:185 stop:751 length:567 start_codon:yes stop_codon:yes gene_type:complete
MSRNRRYVLALLGLSLAVVVGSILWGEKRKVMATPITSWTEDVVADCAIVLTGGPFRIREGMDLLSQGRVKKLIVSGVNPNSNLLDIFPNLPFYGTVSEDDIVLEKNSQTTYGNAQQSLQVTEVLKCRDVILITSRLHMYRSLNTFMSIFPAELQIYPRAIVAGRYQPKLGSIMVETIKSLFYGLWVY